MDISWQRGISLIEVMLGLVVVALMAAYAVPWYGDYVRRAQVSEGIELAAEAKTKVVEMVVLGDFRTGPAILNSGCSGGSCWYEVINPMGTELETVTTPNTKFVRTIVTFGQYVVIYYKPVFGDGNTQMDYTLIYKPLIRDGDVNWECLAGDKATAARNDMMNQGYLPAIPLPARFAPANCRS